ncbi:hypothetical protein ABZT17_35820 [Streptomyces sp. NPDC005648]|uniref:hypothetical protein n=1 Tax=Streptomyces sp. NPDC005648 TaxID=3157044 RepID=UPI0033ACBD47
MRTTSPRPLPLTPEAIPDGCLAWDGVAARRWTDALPARWVPVRAPRRLVLSLAGLGLVGGILLSFAGVPSFIAAFLGLQVLWLLARPEVVRFTAAAQVLMAVGLLGHGPLSPTWPLPAAGVLMAAFCAYATQLRMTARLRQRDLALAAAGGVTAVLPAAEQPFWRGKLLRVLGVLLALAGVGLAAAAGAGLDSADDRHADLALGFGLAGFGLTMLLSGHLGRRRAAELRRGPAPVLRVLVREGGGLDTEVFAADDVGALRPLFTVSLTGVEDGADGDEGEDDGEEDDEELLGRVGEGGDDPGPLREAVLYGAPYDGAEVLLVSAAERAGEPPVVERSTGPVRPLSDGHVRRGLRREKALAKQDAVYEERSRAAARAVAGDAYGLGGAGVRRWRAGWADWLSAAATALWAAYIAVWGEHGVQRWLFGGVAGVVAVLMLPRWVAWRITADREGLWFNALHRPQHIAWDDIRSVECKGTELKVDSRRVGFEEWSVFGFRWPWAERRLGLIHPYERAAAEIRAMWERPSVRPAGECGERERRRRVWPLSVVVAVGWVAVLLLVP